MQIGNANYMSNEALNATQVLHDQVIGKIPGCIKALSHTYMMYSLPPEGTCDKLPPHFKKECLERTMGSASDAASHLLFGLAVGLGVSVFPSPRTQALLGL